MKEKEERIRDLTIDAGERILEALQLMDRQDRKLLLVIENGKFKSILSIGDIQRAIIKNLDLDSKVSDILRPKIRVANSNDSLEEIKKMMLEFRMEFIPVLDENGEVDEIYFWDEFFAKEISVNKTDLKIPVVIMAGGSGTRLRPFSYILPKPLFPVGDKSIVEEIISRFEKIGSNEFYLTVNYKHEMIRYHFDQIQNKTYKVSFVLEDKPLGTAGSLHLLEGKLKSTFFVSNCDILIQQDYSEIYDYHIKHENEITIVASLKHYNIPYGTLETGEDGALLSIAEKPKLTFKINTGMYILEPHLLKEIPKNTFFHITQLIENVRSRGGKIGVFPVSEKSWQDIGEWGEYQKTMDFLKKGYDV